MKGLVNTELPALQLNQMFCMTHPEVANKESKAKGFVGFNMKKASSFLKLLNRILKLLAYSEPQSLFCIPGDIDI